MRILFLILFVCLPLSSFAAASFDIAVLDQEAAKLLKAWTNDDSPGLKETRDSAKQGDATAQVRLGLFYQTGTHVDRNVTEAAKWFRKAAESGHVEGQYLLAIYLTHLPHPEREEQTQWLVAAAKQGHPSAMNSLSEALEELNTDSQYTKAAREYMIKAAEAGHLHAMFRYGDKLMHGNLGLPQDVERGAKLIQDAAALGGTGALYGLGLMHVDGRGVPEDVDKGIEYLKRSAKAELSDENYRMGEAPFKLYQILNTKSLGRVDVPLANQYLMQAVDAGHLDAIFVAGVRTRDGYKLPNGKEVKPDIQQAMKLFHRGAEAGDLNCIRQLATEYASGDNIAADYDKARKWAKLGVERGEKVCQWVYGVIHYGEGDLKSAEKWLEKSAAQGFERAKTSLKKIREEIKDAK